MVQVCRERKEGKDPDMSVLLGLRSKFNPSQICHSTKRIQFDLERSDALSNYLMMSLKYRKECFI